jgi:hypothetical protein
MTRYQKSAAHRSYTHMLEVHLANGSIEIHHVRGLNRTVAARQHARRLSGWDVVAILPAFAF